MKGAAIGPFAFIGEGVKIGARAVIHPHVTLYQGAQIGDDFLAHSHAVVREIPVTSSATASSCRTESSLAGDGFGFAKDAEGRHHKIVQSGVTVLEDDVEVQSLTSVDRATGRRKSPG